MTECFALDDIGTQIEEKRSKEEKGNRVAQPSATKSVDLSQVMMVLGLTCILVLSIALVVYAARH